MTFNNDELDLLHTFLEGRAEVLEDDGDTAGAKRLYAIIEQGASPTISKEDAEWLLEAARDYDDELGADTLCAKLSAIGGER